MPKPIRRGNGQFNGSIGDGARNTPTAPPAPLTSAPTGGGIPMQPLVSPPTGPASYSGPTVSLADTGFPAVRRKNRARLRRAGVTALAGGVVTDIAREEHAAAFEFALGHAEATFPADLPHRDAHIRCAAYQSVTVLPEPVPHVDQAVWEAETEHANRDLQHRLAGMSDRAREQALEVEFGDRLRRTRAIRDGMQPEASAEQVRTAWSYLPRDIDDTRVEVLLPRPNTPGEVLEEVLREAHIPDGAESLHWLPVMVAEHPNATGAVLDTLAFTSTNPRALRAVVAHPNATEEGRTAAWLHLSNLD